MLTLPHPQHPFSVEFVERQVRVQIKDQIDRMKRRKVDEYEYSGSDEEGSGGGSLDHPTIKKSDEGVAISGHYLELSLFSLLTI